ncbi:hypothetical protein V1478_002807, partial [Vespula squamosa]
MEGRTVGRKGKDPKSITRVPVKGPALPLEKVTKVASGDLNGKQVLFFFSKKKKKKKGKKKKRIKGRGDTDRERKYRRSISREATRLRQGCLEWNKSEGRRTRAHYVDRAVAAPPAAAVTAAVTAAAAAS